MANSTFKMKRVPLAILTTVALGSYTMAAILNFGDIQNAWQLMIGYSAIVLIYAFLREKKVKSMSNIVGSGT